MVKVGIILVLFKLGKKLSKQGQNQTFFSALSATSAIL